MKKVRPIHWERKSSMRRVSQRQEKRLSKELGCRLTPNSGATSTAKGDAKDATFLYEMKTTTTKRFPVDTSVLRKIWLEAAVTGRLPVVVVTMDAMPEPAPHDWVVIEKTTFDSLFLNERGERCSK